MVRRGPGACQSYTQRPHELVYCPSCSTCGRAVIWRAACAKRGARSGVTDADSSASRQVALLRARYRDTELSEFGLRPEQQSIDAEGHLGVPFVAGGRLAGPGLGSSLGESEPSARDGELVAECRPAAPAASCQPGPAGGVRPRGMRRSGRPWRRGPGAAS
eukprot:14036228-Alexandrium_andersonii.AAC.1